MTNKLYATYVEGADGKRYFEREIVVTCGMDLVIAHKAAQAWFMAIKDTDEGYDIARPHRVRQPFIREL